MMEVPVYARPRNGTDLLIKNQEFLGTHELVKTTDAEVFMAKDALGQPESWWVASHGKWCPYYHYDYYYYHYYYCYY